jgi:hypothetical protein
MNPWWHYLRPRYLFATWRAGVDVDVMVILNKGVLRSKAVARRYGTPTARMVGLRSKRW